MNRVIYETGTKKNMFTGLVEELGEVVGLEEVGPGVKLTIKATTVSQDVSLGASIAINGCCLTVVSSEGDSLVFDAGSETLSRTNLGELRVGSRVNLERSLRVGDRMGGHFVTGHIDATGKLDERNDDGDWAEFWFSMPASLRPQMASKGSVAVDGVSLTLVNVEETRFSIALIPHTLQVTTLGKLSVGDTVNLETDLLAKYVGEAFDKEIAV